MEQAEVCVSDKDRPEKMRQLREIYEDAVARAGKVCPLSAPDLKGMLHYEDIVRIYYDRITVKTKSEPRALVFVIPEKMATCETLRGRLMFKSMYRYFYPPEQHLWKLLVRCAVDKAVDMGCENIRFDKALVCITAHQPIARDWDIDNFVTSFINNALVETGVIPDDNIDRVRYTVRGIRDASCPEPYTKIAITDEFEENIYCHLCKL